MTRSVFDTRMASAICAITAPFYLIFPQVVLAQNGNSSPVDIEAALEDADTQNRTAGHENHQQQPLNLEIESPSSNRQQALQDESYNIGPVLITGTGVMQAVDFLDIIEVFSARRLSPQDLSDLTNQIVNRARESGYVFASAWIEPQSLEAGVLRVTLDEGTITQLRISGDDDPAIHAQLAPLLNGRPVTLQQLERQILLADDIAGIWIRSTRFIREGRNGILLIDARRQSFRASVQLENSGTQTVGPYRARITADANGLLTSTDRINLTYSSTPFQPGELQYGRLRYQVVVNSSGTRLGVTGSYSEASPGAYLSSANLDGISWAIGLNLRQPILRSRAFSLWFEGDLELRQLRQEAGGILHRLDRVPVIRAGLFASAPVAGGRLRGRLTYSRGVNGLGATQLGDPLSSRRDASTAFDKLSAWANWTGPVAGNFSLSLAGQGQIASAPLLISEDMGLGGRNFLRGYAYNQRSGDEGVMGSAEIRYDWNRALGLVRRVQVYAFADGGVVGNLDGGYGSGSLASSGGGLRTDITRNLDLDLEVAVPLTGVRYDTGDLEPQINFRVRRSF